MSEKPVTGPKFPVAFPAGRVAVAMKVAEDFGWVEGSFGRLCRASHQGGDVLASSIESAADAMARLGWIVGFTDAGGRYMWCPSWSVVPDRHEEALAAELLVQASQSGR